MYGSCVRLKKKKIFILLVGTYIICYSCALFKYNNIMIKCDQI